MTKKSLLLRKLKKAIRELNPIDDLMFRKMAEKKEFCEELLREILLDSKLQVLENYSQYSLTNVAGKSVILDAYCVLSDGKRVNVEVQNLNNLDHQRRVRYYSSVLTSNMVERGGNYDDIPEVYMVYISNFDLFNLGRIIYYVKRSIEGTDIELDNGLKEIYISANIDDGSSLSELMAVFTKDEVYNDRFPIISEMKYLFKHSQKGAEMSNLLNEIYLEMEKNVDQATLAKAREEGLEQGRVQGLEQGRVQGLEQGRTQGLEQGRVQGLEQGRVQGREQGIISTLTSLVKDGLLSISEAASRANMSVENFQKYLG